jgi:hypothetical protein
MRNAPRTTQVLGCHAPNVVHGGLRNEKERARNQETGSRILDTGVRKQERKNSCQLRIEHLSPEACDLELLFLPSAPLSQQRANTKTSFSGFRNE